MKTTHSITNGFTKHIKDICFNDSIMQIYAKYMDSTMRNQITLYDALSMEHLNKLKRPQWN